MVENIQSYPLISKAVLSGDILSGRIQDNLLFDGSKVKTFRFLLGYSAGHRLVSYNNISMLVPILLQIKDYIERDTGCKPEIWKAGTHFLKLEKVEELDNSAGFGLHFSYNVHPMLSDVG